MSFLFFLNFGHRDLTKLYSSPKVFSVARLLPEVAGTDKTKFLLSEKKITKKTITKLIHSSHSYI